jgi:hypothetical protein
MATTYMALSLPTVSSTIGPTWATMLNTALTTVDSHTHVSGQGQQVPTAGINVNADFPVNSFNLTLARSVRFVSQSSPLALTTDANCLSVSGGNLYYNNGSAQSVQITSGAALSASSLGGISGLSAPASAAFSSSTATFTWQSNTNKAAIMDCGPVLIRDTATSALAVTLQSPVSLAANYSITLPATLPASTVLLQMSSAGVVSASNTVASAIAISGSTPTAPSMASNWSASSGLAYWKDAVGMVHIKGGGTASSGVSGQTAFTLPAGFRPLFQRNFVIQNGVGTVLGCSVGTDGTVSLGSAAATTSYFFDPIAFLAEA